MAVLTLDYRCCNRKLPLYIKHIEVERIDEPMEYFYGWDGPIRPAGTKRRHRIPAYFEDMEDIWQELEEIQSRSGQ